ncbi:hypothetical protein AX16_006390 [Volvariella volvacea WC 439]|nr:hypothetical protein AX16_006390 [Volvariella volvacea WC 439]
MSTTSNASYAALLSHLYSKQLRIPFQTLQSAISYHLAEAQPSPTSLTASTISSVHFTNEPFTFQQLQTLSTVFRHAVHLKHRDLKKEYENTSVVASVFKPGFNARMTEWVEGVVRGLQGGHPVLRLTGCTGVLLGLEDLRVERLKEKGTLSSQDEEDSLKERGKGRVRVEAEIMVALAETLDMYPGYGATGLERGASSWEKEFASKAHDTLSLALILASQSLPLVEESKLQAFPLRLLVQLLVSTMSSAFQDGRLLSTLPSSLQRSDEGIHIPKDSPMAIHQQSMNSSVIMQSMSALSRLMARSLTVLLGHRPVDGVAAFSDALKVLESLAARVESDWYQSELASVTQEDGIAPDTREITVSIWTTLKTLLFSIIMVSDAGLSSIVFLPPSINTTPQSMASQTLYALFHLSFVITKFGGVTTTSVHGLRELKKAFYLAIDVISQGSLRECEDFVEELSTRVHSNAVDSNSPHAQARKAYVLAAVEQLVPVLGPTCIELMVFPLCYPHLWDPSHRETFESAHSVILSIFAAHAEKTSQSLAERGSPTGYKTFIQKLVPFYVDCLIKNSVNGGLETSQLRLAYSSLVRSASASSQDGLIQQEITPSPSSQPSPSQGHYALSWFCIDRLIGAIRDVEKQIERPADLASSQNQEERQKDKARLYKLHLTLISTVSSLPLPLLIRTLEEIRGIIAKYPLIPFPATKGKETDQEDDGKAKAQSEGERKELVDALFEELLEKVGDREKEEAVRWWYKHRDELLHGRKQDEDSGSGLAPNLDFLSERIGSLVSRGKDVLRSML